MTDSLKEPESFGEVNLMIELKQNPGADKLLNVKVLTAEGLQYKATSFRPYISLDIIGPGMKNFKRNRDSADRIWAIMSTVGNQPT